MRSPAGSLTRPTSCTGASAPGLSESVYETVLARGHQRRDFQVERQKPIAFDCDGMHVVDGLRVDLLVERLVVVEIKSVEGLLPVHPKQVLQRVVNGLDRSASPRESIRRRRLATPT